MHLKNISLNINKIRPSDIEDMLLQYPYKNECNRETASCYNTVSRFIYVEYGIISS